MIQRRIQDKGSPWLIEAILAMQVAPTLILATAYLPPSSTSPALRRGSEMRLSRYLDDEDPPIKGWQVTPGRFAYAQVTLPTWRALRTCDAPEGWERPFEVKGNLSDEDIIAVVQLVKSSPHKSSATMNPDGSTSLESWKVDGKNRILVVEATGEATLKVQTEEQIGAGQLVEFEKAATGEWEIVKVWQWNA
jgi:hypothetical protein